MNPIFLMIVADQEGDADWQVYMTKADAQRDLPIMQETAFDTPKIWEIDTATLAVKEVA